MTEMEASDVARKAAELMSERGHCKFRLESADGQLCYIGALNMALYGVSFPVTQSDDRLLNLIMNTSTCIIQDRARAAGELKHISLREPWEHDPIAWNNRPETSGEDVILLLKETAARLEGLGSAA